MSPHLSPLRWPHWSTVPLRLKENLKTILLGLAAALVALAFLVATKETFALAYGSISGAGVGRFALVSFLIITSTSLASGLLLRYVSPGAAGSGIPQLKAAYWKEGGDLGLKPVVVKFAAGVLAIGGGSSLGREGPTVFMGGGIASWLSGRLGQPKGRRRGPALIGAAAGLAAAFNTPLAAITFVLEEIVGDLSSKSIRKVLIAAIVGAFTVYGLIGREPSFHVPNLEAITWPQYALAIPVALLASTLGVLFHRLTIGLRGAVRQEPRLPLWLAPVLGALATWVLGVGVYALTGKIGVFGLGYGDLAAVLTDDFIWWMAGILVLGKFLATVASYGFGGCGGIFSPTLFLGGLTGYFIAGLGSLWIPLTSADRIILAAVGMSACLGTVVKAPLSAMLIVFEMTHHFSMIPGLLIGMAISMVVGRLSGSANFYEDILLQDGHRQEEVSPPLDLPEWQSQGIGSLATWEAQCVTDPSPAALASLLDRYPYRAFPVLRDGAILGIATRGSLEAAKDKGGWPALTKAVVVGEDATVREVAQRFVATHADLVIIRKKGQTGELGVVTLRDLVRAEKAVAERWDT